MASNSSELVLLALLPSDGLVGGSALSSTDFVRMGVRARSSKDRPCSIVAKPLPERPFLHFYLFQTQNILAHRSRLALNF